jgi:hypothetical protein
MDGRGKQNLSASFNSVFRTLIVEIKRIWESLKKHRGHYIKIIGIH